MTNRYIPICSECEKELEGEELETEGTRCKECEKKIIGEKCQE